MPLKRGRNPEEEQHYYEQLMLRTHPDELMEGRKVLFFTLRDINMDNKSVMACLDYWEKGIAAMGNVVTPLIAVYNYVHNYVNNHTPWTSISLSGQNNRIIRPNEVFGCLRKLCRDNQELVLKQLNYNNRQRSAMLDALAFDEGIDEFLAIYGESDNDQQMSNICWDLGLYRPEEDSLYFSRFMGNYSYHLRYLEGIQEHDYEEEDEADYALKVSNVTILTEVQQFYQKYCDIRNHIADNYLHFNGKEKCIIEKIVSRPEGADFKMLYEGGETSVLDVNFAEIKEYRLLQKIKDPIQPFGEIKHRRSRGPASWLTDDYSILDENDARAILQSSKIWSDLCLMIRNGCSFPRMDVGKNKDAAVNGLCAGLLYYVAMRERIAISCSSNVPISYERTITFMDDKPEAPRSSISKYYVMLKDWMPNYDPLRQKSNEQIKRIVEWQKKDSVRCRVLTYGGNYNQLRNCIEFLEEHLPQAFNEAVRHKTIMQSNQSDK